MGRGKTDIVEAVTKAIKATKIAHPRNFKRLIYKLKSRGYLERREDYLRITQLGKERLLRNLPKYEKERPWDGIIYLITYDIPEERKNECDFVRSYLQKLGCGMLQHSVWLTPYNPKKLIADLVKERKLVGLILVSELREGSNIGGQDIRRVIAKVYQLDKIEQEYRDFVRAAEAKKLAGAQLIMTYYSILKRDPQLPFELLSDSWWGEDAYEVYKKELRRLGLGKKEEKS